jgi:DNA-directed RNA polymerase II subunit RPB2
MASASKTSSRRSNKKKNANENSINSLQTYSTTDSFKLLDLYFEIPRILVKHQLDSYRYFVEVIIPNVLQSGENVINEKLSATTCVRYRLTFTDLAILPPVTDNDKTLLYPIDTLTKNLPYSGSYTTTVTQWQDVTDIETGKVTSKIVHGPEKDVPIGKIPIMVGSQFCSTVLKPNSQKQCPWDMGGYFIINGNEKVVLSVESVVHRRPMVTAQKEQNNIIYSVRVGSRAAHLSSGNLQTFIIKRKKDGSLVLNIAWFKEISVFTLMRALGLQTDKDIVESILDPSVEKIMLNELSLSMNAKNSPAYSGEEALDFLATNLKSFKYNLSNDQATAHLQKRAHVLKILSEYILPHITSETNLPALNMYNKACYIGYMINKLLKCYIVGGSAGATDTEEANRGCFDRDSMVNKFVELPGTLLGALFDQQFKKMLSDCSRVFKTNNASDEKPYNIISQIKPNTIEQGLRQAMSTGSFGANTNKGLSQQLNRMNYLHALSSLRRVITPLADASNNKLTGPRHLHVTQMLIMDPLETPEGPKTGIVKNMALLTTVTLNLTSTQVPIIKDYLKGKITFMDDVDDKKKFHSFYKIFINGSPVGIVDVNDIDAIAKTLREKRFNGEINRTVGLVKYSDIKEYHIFTNGGRLMRPYFTVTENTLNFKSEMLNGIKTWDEFLLKHPKVIEYVDIEEAQQMMLAMTPEDLDIARAIMTKPVLKTQEEIDLVNKTNRYDGNVFNRYSHCEIHPSMMLGLISSNVPFPNHNQGPRGIFQYNQARQAMGLYASNYRERTDISYILYHPQIPIVTPRASKYTGSHIFPSGENVIVAIASYTGLTSKLSPCRSKSYGKSTLW